MNRMCNYIQGDPSGLSKPIVDIDKLRFSMRTLY